MRTTLHLFSRIRAVPASSIAASEIRLPQPEYRAVKTTNKGTATIDAAARPVEGASSDLPSNLRLEEFIPPRQLYAGMSEADREIVSFSSGIFSYFARLICSSCSIPAQEARKGMILSFLMQSNFRIHILHCYTLIVHFFRPSLHWNSIHPWVMLLSSCRS